MRLVVVMQVFPDSLSAVCVRRNGGNRGSRRNKGDEGMETKEVG